LLTQFDEVKAQYKDYLLLFQVGDFYELYGKDAELVGDKTSLKVTKRQGVSMAGFPVKALDEWLKTLVEAEFQLAICNQKGYGDSSKLMTREVVQLVTSGTLIEPLSKHANYLMSVTMGTKDTIGLAWIDLSTSQFTVSTSSLNTLDEDLERISPSEVLVSGDLLEGIRLGVAPSQYDHEAFKKLTSSILTDCHLTGVPSEWFGADINDHGLLSDTGELSALERTAAGVVLRFVQHTQKTLAPHISQPSRFTPSAHLSIDASSRRNLELFLPAVGNTKKATLFGCLDRTVTAGGGRLMKDRLSAPLTDIADIDRRLDCVEVFCNNHHVAQHVQTQLKGCCDIERVVQKVATKAASPHDLLAIKNTLQIADMVKGSLGEETSKCASLSEELQGLESFDEVVSEIERSISGNLATWNCRIKKGYSDEMDQLQAALLENEKKVERLAASLSTEHGLSKVSSGPHKSYYRVFAVSKGQSTKVDSSSELIRVDQLTNKIRFTSIELQKLNSQHQHLQQLCDAAEQGIFADLCSKVVLVAGKIVECARALSRLDVYVSLGLLARERGYTRPVLLADQSMNIVKGRHPVVDALQGGHFVCNDCDMNQHKIWIITGPNMGGKSTFLRQNSLIVIMAQMGSFVPASEATIGVVDSVFARIGASDNIVKHMSTFHMEMSETAHILMNATGKSFIILDEIGRGTSTSEGFSLAQAILEHVRDKIGCRTLLATHFHKLSDFANDSSSEIGAYKLIAERSDSGILFTYRIEAGSSGYSYGVDVAELAGLPSQVIDRAKELMCTFQ
jgi:DNA mismatch repair protein MutS